jgi:tagatose-1,6-bisphosphate aldolase non-catalytic subunit AgaZ/GatZ
MSQTAAAAPAVEEPDSREQKCTVSDALADRARRLQELLDWARTRLDRAAALALLATEPPRPGGEPNIHQAADTLGLAENAADDVWTVLGEYREARTLPDLLALVEGTLDHAGAAMTDAEFDTWDPEAVAGLTVAELAARLSRLAGATA